MNTTDRKMNGSSTYCTRKISGSGSGRGTTMKRTFLRHTVQDVEQTGGLVLSHRGEAG